jgi:hypothetical protein
MLEFEPDQESVSRAEQLSSRLLGDLQMVMEAGAPSDMRSEIFSEHRYVEQAEDVPVGDVVVNVGQMATEFAMARRWGGEIICLKLGSGDLAPISIAELFGGPMWGPYGSEHWIELWDRCVPFPFPPHRFFRDVIRRSAREEERVVVLDLGEALKGVGDSLGRFLSYRFAGMRKWGHWIHGRRSQRFGGSRRPPRGSGIGRGDSPLPPAVGPGGGLQVQVSCLTHGLRIHVSHAYFISWVFFGSPTTPVTSYVLPGRYIFAGDGPMLPTRTEDDAIFCIPPTFYPSLTRF